MVKKIFYRNVSLRCVTGQDTHTHTHTHTHTRARARADTDTHPHTDCTVYNCISVCRELQYGRKYLRKAEIHVSIFSLPFSDLARFYFSISTIPSYLETQVLLPISQRDVGSISDRGAEITERAEANVRQPFSGLAGWLPTGSRLEETGREGERGKEDSSVVSQFPQSTRYERFSRQISPLVERVSFTSQRTGLSKMLIKFFITP